MLKKHENVNKPEVKRIHNSALEKTDNVFCDYKLTSHKFITTADLYSNVYYDRDLCIKLFIMIAKLPVKC